MTGCYEFSLLPKYLQDVCYSVGIPWSLRPFNIINYNLGDRSTYLNQLNPCILIGLFYCRSSGKSVDK